MEVVKFDVLVAQDIRVRCSSPLILLQQITANQSETKCTQCSTQDNGLGMYRAGIADLLDIKGRPQRLMDVVMKDMQRDGVTVRVRWRQMVLW